MRELSLSPRNADKGLQSIGESDQMQHNLTREWLVRTRSGEILGPFSQTELVQALRAQLFSTEDEISKTRGPWLSAQSLSWRESEEFTLTQTRTQLPNTGSVSVTPVGGYSQSAAAPLLEEPEPDLAKAPQIHPVPEKPPQAISRWASIAMAFVLVGIVWGFVFHARFSPSRPEQERKFPSAKIPNSEASPFLQQLEILIQAGQYEAVINRLEPYHQKHEGKKSVDYLIPYATALILQDQSLPQAKRFLEHVLSSPFATPELRSRAHLWLGYLLLSSGEGDRGENHFLEALQLNPKDAASRFNLGCAYLKQKKAQQALDYLQLAELEVPHLWLVHIYKGRAKKALGMIEDARASFQKAIATAPDRWLTYLYYAVFLKANRETEGAAQTLLSMLTRDPHFEQQTPAPLGFFEEEVPLSDYLETYEEILPKSLGEPRELGRLYMGLLIHGPQGNEAKRLEALSDKGHLMAKVFALKVALDRGISGEPLKAAIEKLPRDLNGFSYYAYVLRAQAYLRLEALGQAEEDLKEALRIEPRSASARWTRIALLRAQKQEKLAEDQTLELLSLEPRYLPALKSLKLQ